MVYYSTFCDNLHELDFSPSPVGLLSLLAMGAVRKSLDQGHKESLQSLLLYLSHFKASEPRDKMFALFGLAQEVDDDDVLRPDYKISPQQMYLKVTQHLLLRDPFIHLLRPDVQASCQREEVLHNGIRLYGRYKSCGGKGR